MPLEWPHMNDDTATGNGPTSTQPTGDPDLGLPGDSPLADAPEPEGPEPDSAEPEAKAAGQDGAAVPLDEDTLPDADLSLEAVVDVAPTADETTVEPVDEPAEPRHETRRLSRGERDVYDRTRQRFAACSRCGYLIADCLLLVGEETLQNAAIRSRDGWLRLEGDERLRLLLDKAFGVRLGLGYDYMDGTCPECRRRFVFAALESGQVRLKLRT